jgi:hypothetical protein
MASLREKVNVELEELKLLIDNVFCVYSSFKREIDTFLAK